MRPAVLALTLLLAVPTALAVPPPSDGPGSCIATQGTEVSVTVKNCITYDGLGLQADRPEAGGDCIVWSGLLTIRVKPENCLDAVRG